MTSAEGYSSIPREEEGTASAAGSEAAASINQPTPRNINGDHQGLYAKLTSWWKKSPFSSTASENAPLINRNRMTLEPPTKSNMRIAFEIVSIVGAFTIIAAIIILSVADTNEVGGKIQDGHFGVLYLPVTKTGFVLNRFSQKKINQNRKNDVGSSLHQETSRLSSKLYFCASCSRY